MHKDPLENTTNFDLEPDGDGFNFIWKKYF